jgi:hypothetical protein
MTIFEPLSHLFETEVMPEVATWGCRLTLTMSYYSRSVFVQFLTENADILP